MKTLNYLNRGGSIFLDVINPRLSVKSERGWNLNKSKATNGIATWNDIPGTYVNKVGKTGNQCPKIGDIVSANNSNNYIFKYNGSLQTATNNQLAVYSKCSWTSKSVNYTITFTGYNAYSMLFLANGSLMVGTYPSSNRIGFPLADGRGSVTWRSDTGLVVNKASTAGQNAVILKGGTVYVFIGSGSSYSKIDQFVLEASNQTVTY